MLRGLLNMQDEKKQKLIAEVIDSIRMLDDDNLQKLGKFIAELKADRSRNESEEVDKRNDS
jgi:cytochrome c553